MRTQDLLEVWWNRAGHIRTASHLTRDSLLKYFFSQPSLHLKFYFRDLEGFWVPPNPCGPVVEKGSVGLTGISLISMSWCCGSVCICSVGRGGQQRGAGPPNCVCGGAGGTAGHHGGPGQSRTSTGLNLSVGGGTSADPNMNINVYHRLCSFWNGSIKKPGICFYLSLQKSAWSFDNRPFFYQLCWFKLKFLFIVKCRCWGHVTIISTKNIWNKKENKWLFSTFF